MKGRSVIIAISNDGQDWDEESYQVVIPALNVFISLRAGDALLMPSALFAHYNTEALVTIPRQPTRSSLVFFIHQSLLDMAAAQGADPKLPANVAQVQKRRAQFDKSASVGSKFTAPSRPSAPTPKKNGKPPGSAKERVNKRIRFGSD